MKMTSYRRLSAAKTRQSTAIDVKRDLQTQFTGSLYTNCTFINSSHHQSINFLFLYSHIPMHRLL